MATQHSLLLSHIAFMIFNGISPEELVRQVGISPSIIVMAYAQLGLPSPDLESLVKAHVGYSRTEREVLDDEEASETREDKVLDSARPQASSSSDHCSDASSSKALPTADIIQPHTLSPFATPTETSESVAAGLLQADREKALRDRLFKSLQSRRHKKAEKEPRTLPETGGGASVPSRPSRGVGNHGNPFLSSGPVIIAFDLSDDDADV